MKLKKDTGLTQQPREFCPALPPKEIQGTHVEHPDTPSSPWSDQGVEDDPEYPEQSDNPGEHSEDNPPAKGNNENTSVTPQSQHDNPEVSTNTGYPDTQDTNTGSPGILETDKSSDKEQEIISTSQQVTPIPQSGDPGFVDITQGNQATEGIGKDDLNIMPCAPILDEFFKNDNRGRALKVRFKNTARVRVTDHNQDPTLSVDPSITDEFSSQTGGHGGPPERDKTN